MTASFGEPSAALLASEQVGESASLASIRHRLKAVAWLPYSFLAICRCGDGFDAPTAETARDMHERHAEEQT